MKLSVQELLNFPIMKDAVIHTAPETLSYRFIESVSRIEIPIENFIHKNELVLTIAIGCSNTNSFKQFVHEIIKLNAAAMVISAKQHPKKIPDDVFHLAEKFRFPIISIPWEIRFVDIMQPVLERLNHKYQDLQKDLFNLYVADCDLSDAANLIYRKLERQVVITSVEGKIKGKSDQSKHLAAKLMTYFNKRILSNRSNICEQIPHDSFITLKIETPNKLYGYLFLETTVQENDKAYLRNLEEVIAEHIIHIISLWFNKEYVVQKTEMKLKYDFVWRIAKGIDSWDEVSSQANVLGFDLSVPYVCIMGMIEYNKKNFVENVTSIIADEVILASKNIKKLAMVTFHNERLIIFLEASHCSSEILKYVNGFIDMVESQVKYLFSNITMSWGIDETGGIKSFHKSFIRAQVALAICYRRKGPGNRGTNANTHVYRMLLGIASDQVIQNNTQAILENLIEEENRSGIDLFNTFRAYVENQYNVSKTARSLYIHRQSLLYRLKKIESLTNRSLKNPDDLFLLDLCTRIWALDDIQAPK